MPARLYSLLLPLEPPGRARTAPVSIAAVVVALAILAAGVALALLL